MHSSSKKNGQKQKWRRKTARCVNWKRRKVNQFFFCGSEKTKHCLFYFDVYFMYIYIRNVSVWRAVWDTLDVFLLQILCRCSVTELEQTKADLDCSFDKRLQTPAVGCDCVLLDWEPITTEQLDTLYVIVAEEAELDFTESCGRHHVTHSHLQGHTRVFFSYSIAQWAKQQLRRQTEQTFSF